jgi:hypothetical protein
MNPTTTSTTPTDVDADANVDKVEVDETNVDPEQATSKTMPSASPPPPTHRQSMFLHTFSTSQLIVGFIILALTIIAFTFGLLYGLDNDDCNDNTISSPQGYRVTLTVSQIGPPIQTTADTTNVVYLPGNDAMTWHFLFDDRNQPPPLLTSIGNDGWFDKAVQIQNYSDNNKRSM